MFLKSLEVKGFKSFADKTDLKFKSGITAVVGPNGSGKSNVSDAVRWVLGEQSVKSLRGGKMEDVIFAGTQFRKPVGLAQVSITLDNLKGKLPTDYNEVTVTRKIFRSGETEYLINNQKCRLKDITELFMDTGIGKEGYSLIGQGKIDAILSGKTEERRALFEEAAGIIKYKARKEEAEKKLNNTDSNLIRIRDIINTYEERLEPLKKDKEKALVYKELAEELKIKEVSTILKELEELKINIRDIDQNIIGKQNTISSKRELLEDYKIEILKLEEKIATLEKTNEESKEKFYKRKELVNKNINDIELFKERVANFEELINKEQSELENIKGSLDELYRDRENIRSEVENKEIELNIKNEEIVNLEKEIYDLNIEIENITNELNELKSNEFEFISNKSELNSNINIIEKDIEINELREKELKKILNNYKEDKVKKESILEELFNKINDTKLDINKLEKLNTLNSEERKNKYRELNQNQLYSENVTKKINELEATYLALSNLEKNYEGYNRTVKQLMDKIKRNNIKDIGSIKILGEVLKIKKEYEIAIEISLGAAISNVITETDEEAKKLINYLKENKIGRATFLPLNLIKGRKIQVTKEIMNLKGYIGIASELIDVNEKYSEIVEYSLGRVIIVEDMNSAVNISKITKHIYKIVTLTGEVINPGGSLTGGAILGKNSNLLGRKRELDEINLKVLENKENQKNIIEKIERIKSEIEKIDNQISKTKDGINDKKIFSAKIENDIGNISHDLKNYKKLINEVQEEEKSINYRANNLQKSLQAKVEELGKIGELNFKSKEKVKCIEIDLEEYIPKANLLKEKLTNIMIYKATLEEWVQGKKNELEIKEKTIDEKEKNIENIKKDIESKEVNVSNLLIDIEEKREKITEIEIDIKKLENLFKEDEVKKIEYKEFLKEKNNLSNELVDVVRGLEVELNKKEISKAKLDSDKEGIYRRLNEEMNLTLAEAEEISVDIIEVKATKEDIQKIKIKISSLGVVNLSAIVEYDEVLEKYEFMTTQELDLEQAKRELSELIEDMTKKMQNIFSENFKILNENFSETFKELFKGGTAELILGEGDELNANIIINVQPPGKKLQNINLMSGGEKVLSAIALLFAILKMKPTPFCILDEIEAALDDANVFRYAEFLKKFSGDIQFIVITHRKGTMEASDVMYGVTMEEKGVSKVVSVDLSKD